MHQGGKALIFLQSLATQGVGKTLNAYLSAICSYTTPEGENRGQWKQMKPR